MHRLLHILLIEDNPDDQHLYKTYLSKDREHEYTFSFAQTGEEGISFYQKEWFDCIILDYNLPDMDGIEFLDTIAQASQPLKAPVIFLTGQGDETVAVEAMKKGVYDYLVKGKVNNEVLVRSVKYSIGEKRIQDAQKEHLLFLETLIDTIPNPIFFKDVGGIIRGCNKAFESFTNRPKSELIGQSDAIIMPDEFARQCKESDYTLLHAPGIDSFEGQVSFDGEDTRYVLVYKASYTNLFGEVEGLVGVIIDITERKRAEERAKRLALYDELTELPNRRLFFERLSRAISRAQRNHTFVAIMYVDLNGFKPINDTYGHEAGDVVLCEIGKRFGHDIRMADTAARIGGDEFGIILPDLDRTDGVIKVADKIAASIQEPILYDGSSLYVVASIGISIYPTDGKQMDELVNMADKAMYIAKSASKKTTAGRFSHNIVFYSLIKGTDNE